MRVVGVWFVGTRLRQQAGGHVCGREQLRGALRAPG